MFEAIIYNEILQGRAIQTSAQLAEALLEPLTLANIERILRLHALLGAQLAELRTDSTD